MLRLPSRNVSHTFSRFAPTTLATYGTLAPTAPRRWQHNKKPDRHGRIDQVDHIPTTFLGRALLTAGSALGLLNNPSRGGKLHTQLMCF